MIAYPGEVIASCSVLMALATPTVAALMATALGRANVSRKAVAADMGVSESYLSRAIAGEKRFPFDRFLHADPAVVRAMGEALVEAAGGEAPVTPSMLRGVVRHELQSALRECAVSVLPLMVHDERGATCD